MLEGNYEAKLEFPEGRSGPNQKPSNWHGRGRIIFWNKTINVIKINTPHKINSQKLAMTLRIT